MLTHEVLIVEFVAVDGFAASALYIFLSVSNSSLKMHAVEVQSAVEARIHPSVEFRYSLSTHIMIRKITPLKHEAWNDAMESRPLIPVPLFPRA